MLELNEIHKHIIDNLENRVNGVNPLIALRGCEEYGPQATNQALNDLIDNEIVERDYVHTRINGKRTSFVLYRLNVTYNWNKLVVVKQRIIKNLENCVVALSESEALQGCDLERGREALNKLFNDGIITMSHYRAADDDTIVTTYQLNESSG